MSLAALWIVAAVVALVIVAVLKVRRAERTLQAMLADVAVPTPAQLVPMPTIAAQTEVRELVPAFTGQRVGASALGF